MVAAQHNMLALRSGERIGPYTLVRQLGTGGMAVVWEATRSDGSIDRRVALKLPLHRFWQPGHAERFARERQLLARLEHPNIARLYDAGVVPPGSPLEGAPFLVLEFVEGEGITTCCDRQRLDIRQRLQLFAQALEAVQYAHTRLVIHRDLKPANILVTADGRVRLLDFGIGKLLGTDTDTDDSVTRMTGKPYTPDYASPEQVRGEDLTTASDVYSLGVVLYQLLCGHPPYQAGDGAMGQVEWAILDHQPALPSTRVDAAAATLRRTSAGALARELRGELDTITGKALDKQPARRYVTVAALAEDLRRHLAGERVLARPDSWAYRARKYALRNKPVAGAAVAIVLALGLGMGAALWQARKAQAALAQAVQLADRNAAVNEFLGTMLSGSALSERITVGQLLALSEEAAKRQFASDPATRAAVRAMVASYYSDAGQYARAAPLWGGVLGDAQSSGQTDLIALASCQREANLVAMGGSQGALERVHQVSAQPRLGAHERASCLYAASEISYELGELDGALRDAQAAQSSLAPVASRYPMEHAVLTGWLATVWGAKQRDDLAEPLHREALAQVHALGRERDAAAVVMANNYAVLMSRIRPVEAVNTLRDLRERFARSTAGASMPAYLLINYGFALLNAGDPLTALEVTDDPALREGGEQWSEQLPQRELIRARAWSDLGRYAEAHAALDHAQALLAASPQIRTALSSLQSVRARLCFREGRLDQARSLAEGLVDDPGTNAVSRAAAKRLLVEVALAQGQPEEAERRARECLAQAEQVRGRTRWSRETGEAWWILGKVLERRDQPAAAREAYVQAREQLAQTVLPVAPMRADLDRRLAAADPPAR